MYHCVLFSEFSTSFADAFVVCIIADVVAVGVVVVSVDVATAASIVGSCRAAIVVLA